MLKALGKTPKVYYNAEYTDSWYNSNYGYNVSNADCVVDSNSYMSSTMGCSAGGKFAVAVGGADTIRTGISSSNYYNMLIGS